MAVIAVPLVLSSVGRAVPDRSVDDEDPVVDAKYGLLEEIDLLAEMDVFAADPIVEQISQQLPTAGETRDELIPVLDDVDDENVGRLDELFDAGLALSGELVTALDPLTALPTLVDPLQITFLAGVAMLLSLGATLLPSRQGARLDPAEGLRFE